MADPIATVIIPARLGSERFPGKVLASATGKPLVVHVAEAVRGARSIARVIVATDDAQVIEAVEANGCEAVATSAHHQNGTSRLSEAAEVLGLADDDIVVNVQGDEPEIEPSVVDLVVEALVTSGADVSTAACPIDDEAEAQNPNVVKVVCDLSGRAMYFSRARAPFVRGGAGAGAGRALRHIGLYCYRVGYLKRYVELAPTPLEQAERLEQLRMLEHGHSIMVAMCDTAHAGIDTPEQYEAFVARWRSG